MALEATFIAPEGYGTTAAALRALTRDLFADAGGTARYGRVRGFGIAPAAPEAGFAVTIDPGSALVATPDGAGAYFVNNYTPETIPWPPAASQPRIDTLVLVVADSDYGSVPSGIMGPSWRVVEGIAAGTPVARSDDDLAAILNTAGGRARWVDVQVPAAPQEAITGNLITARYGEVRPGALKIVQVEDVGVENLTVNPGGDMPNVSPASITVPPSGKVQITMRGTMNVGADSTNRFGYRTEGASVIPFSATWSPTFTKAGVYSFCDVRVVENMAPGATLTVRAAGVTTAAAGVSTVSSIRWVLEQKP